MLAKHSHDLRSEILVFGMLEFLTSESNHLCALALEGYFWALPMFLSLQRLYFTGAELTDRTSKRFRFCGWNCW